MVNSPCLFLWGGGGGGGGRGRGRVPDKTGNWEMLMDVAKYVKKTKLFYYNLNKILH